MTRTVPEKVEDGILRGHGVAGLVALAAASVFLLACQAMPSLLKPRLDEEGSVYLYLQPLPDEADRLVFRLEGISAVRGDGSTIPLSLRIPEIRGKDRKRERLLASGNLPPGEYQGISFRAADATLGGEEGDVTLSLEDPAAKTSLPFSIAREKALVVSLTFRYRESLQGGIRFVPSFSAEIPGKVASGLIGIVTSRRANTITVFDKAAGKVVSVFPTGTSPGGIVLDPLLVRAYVAVSGEDSVEAIDLLGTGIINRRQFVVGDHPEDLALTPDRKTLLLANTGSNTVSVVDAASLLEGRRIPVGIGPQSVLVDRAGRRAYAFNALSSSISVLDIGSGGVVATVATEAGPVRGDFNRAGNRLYVLHKDSPYLTVLDLATLSAVRRVYVGSGGTALKVDSRTDMIYLSRKGTGEVAIYNPFTFLPIDSYRTGGDVSCLAIDGEGNNLFMVLPETSGIRAVRLVGKGTVSEIDVGEDPFWVTMMGER